MQPRRSFGRLTVPRMVPILLLHARTALYWFVYFCAGLIINELGRPNIFFSSFPGICVHCSVCDFCITYAHFLLNFFSFSYWSVGAFYHMILNFNITNTFLSQLFGLIHGDFPIFFLWASGFLWTCLASDGPWWQPLCRMGKTVNRVHSISTEAPRFWLSCGPKDGVPLSWSQFYH